MTALPVRGEPDSDWRKSEDRARGKP